MIVPTKVYIIFGHDVIYETSYDCELLKDESEDDIYEEFGDEDKESLKIRSESFENF